MYEYLSMYVGRYVPLQGFLFQVPKGKHAIDGDNTKFFVDGDTIH